MGRRGRCGWVGAALWLCGCGGVGEGREANLLETLASERRAHLSVDAETLVSTVADTLLVIDGGVVVAQGRAAVEEQFTRYFRGASYQAWDDVAPPVIRIASRGDLAVVHRVVGVERTEPGMGVPTRRLAFQSAWTATYAWESGAWKMTSVASTFLPPPDPARAVVAGALRALGLDALPEDSVLLAEARVTGSTDPFEVRIQSAPGGEARVAFLGGPTLTARVGGGSLTQGQGDVSPLGLPDLTFLRGHEVHLMLLDPAPRLQDLSLVGESEFGGREAIWLRGRDALGSPVDLFYARPDTTPLGYRVTDHMRPGSEAVTLSWTGAESAGATGTAPLFTSGAVFEQGAERFIYRFRTVRWVPRDSVDFESDPGGQSGIGR